MARHSLHKKPRERSSGLGFVTWLIACCMLLITTYLFASGVDRPAPTRVYLASDIVGTR